MPSTPRRTSRASNRPFDRSFIRHALAAAVLGLSVQIACAAEGEAVVKSPHYGPYSQEIASVGTWQVQPGYLSLDPDDTHRLMEKLENPGVTHSWLYAPRDIDKWFALVRYEDTGHVSDDDKIDAAAILEDLKRGAEESNAQRREKGWSELHLIGWQVEPHYESDTRRLSWATLAEADNHRVVNYTTKVLSRTGVTTVTLVTDPDHLDQAITELKSQLGDFALHPDQQYASFRKGDKIAEYGLAGLIVGGAAAAAVKTGAWKWLLGILAAGWKVVAAGVLAVLAGIKSLFRRKR